MNHAALDAEAVREAAQILHRQLAAGSQVKGNLYLPADSPLMR
ncbi:hypothetical protein ACTMTI_46130 [Nonomuraea sp. H19]